MQLLAFEPRHRYRLDERRDVTLGQTDSSNACALYFPPLNSDDSRDDTVTVSSRLFHCSFCGGQ